MPHVYISHDRESLGVARQIYDRLRKLGVEVWIDIHNVPPGADVHKHIDDALNVATAVLAVIGPNWVQELRDDGGFVRMELEHALRRGIPVIPIFVNGAPTLEPKELPGNLETLAYRNGLQLDDGSNFADSIGRLTRSLDAIASRRHPSVDILEKERGVTPGSGNAAGPIPGSAPPPAAPAAGPREPEVEAMAWRRAPSSSAQDTIEFGVSYPAGFKRTTSFVIDAWIYKREDRQKALDRAKEQEPASKFRSAGAASIARGTVVKVQLNVSSWKIEPAVQSIIWDGELTNVAFAVTAPDVLPEGKTAGTCSFFVNGLRIGQVAFQISSMGGTERHVTQGSSIKSAFASYASKDRRRVLPRVQGIEKLGVRVFMDVRDLKAGDPYPVDLLHHIDASDILYLFWSKRASRSEWVEKEWKYGLTEKGLDFIDPVPLVDPRKVPPPDELGMSKHFNDWTLAYLEYEKSLSRWDRFRAWMAGD